MLQEAKLKNRKRPQNATRVHTIVAIYNLVNAKKYYKIM